MTAKFADIKKMSFEDASRELEKIVNHFEGGTISLEDSIEQYTRAIELKSHCSKKLADAKLQVEKITDSGNVISTESFEAKA